ncbi:hypothetical protein BCD96_001147 [Clostridium beijerinckii]|uniref:hypothetical protein n=1 Tax=Clostridium beijerinckii TaxID=1520 RepID=UPI00098C82F7|nr:hypothetical protein [Clostridium beijerinckii]NRU40470.1 hypothetical protein [Clostridium beijerinckii]NSA96254.1 hypothetical protein [Clostridium beijerinckii]OOM62339.1 hypothetical protein CLOBI_22420 [Clostridium beijerinckii]OOM68149.1 hypothetical protein CLBEIC_35250 [Clostridium beijerinckii]CUU46770.1 conserved protein of unknown function [Clostridium beijerinckii]
MYTRNLLSYNYKSNIDSIVIRKINLIKMLFLLLLLIIFLTSIVRFYNFFECVNSSSLPVDDFKTDISMLSEAVNIIETERTSNDNLQINNFGSDGKIVDASEIRTDLAAALIKIGDMDNDKKLSDEEITELGVMKLDTKVIQKELREFQFNLRSSDHNLKNFIVITKGKYAGTILYNGPLKFIDDEHKRYFGLELWMDAK